MVGRWRTPCAEDAGSRPSGAKIVLTRRQVLKRGAFGSAGSLIGRGPFTPAACAAVGATPKLRKWVEPLPVPPVLDARAGGESFTIAARESTTWKFHPDLPATRTWGHWWESPAAGPPYLGPTIVATRRLDDTVDTSVTIEWRNELETAFLPNDPTLMRAVMPGQPVPIVPHLHGGESLPQFDGTPLQSGRSSTSSRAATDCGSSTAPSRASTTSSTSAAAWRCRSRRSAPRADSCARPRR
jgi:hypothetical protein